MARGCCRKFYPKEQAELATLIADREAEGRPLPNYVLGEFEAYMKCGIIGEGKEIIFRARKMQRLGRISQARQDEDVRKEMELINKAESDIASHTRANRKTFGEGLRIIQLFTKVGE